MTATQRDFSAAVPKLALAILVLSAGVSIMLYGLLLRVVPDLAWSKPSYAGDVFPWVELPARGSLGEQHTVAAIRFLGLLAGLLTAYGLTLRAVAGRHSRVLEAAAFAAGALFLGLQTTGPAMLSADLYLYVIYGRIFGLYRSDPYSETPMLDAGDPYLPLLGREFTPSWYGPLWILGSAGLAWFVGEHVGLAVLVFRGAAVAAALLAAALLWDCLRRIAPGQAAQGLVFFLWNPLLVLETGLSGHNDVVMVTLLLLGLWLHVRGHRGLAVAAMTLSVLVKPVAVLVLPLYLLLVLRDRPTWRERRRDLLAGAASAVLVVGVVLGAARTGVDMPAARVGSSAGLYTNSVHELLFGAFRIWLGEEPESVSVPIYFKGWWVATHMATDLRPSPGSSVQSLRRVEPGAVFLVHAPQRSTWLWVYDPETGRKGYLHEDAVVETERPTTADSDPVLAQLEDGPESNPTVVQANAWLRLLTWVAFGVLWGVAAWRVTDLRSVLIWSAAVMLASCWLVAAWFWPWYPIWALGLAAVVPTTWPARLTILFSAAVLSLYASGGYQGSDQEWIYTYRSLPAFVLPLALFILSYSTRLMARSTPTVADDPMHHARDRGRERKADDPYSS